MCAQNPARRFHHAFGICLLPPMFMWEYCFYTLSLPWNILENFSELNLDFHYRRSRFTWMQSNSPNQRSSFQQREPTISSLLGPLSPSRDSKEQNAWLAVCTVFPCLLFSVHTYRSICFGLKTPPNWDMRLISQISSHLQANVLTCAILGLQVRVGDVVSHGAHTFSCFFLPWSKEPFKAIAANFAHDVPEF